MEPWSGSQTGVDTRSKKQANSKDKTSIIQEQGQGHGQSQDWESKKESNYIGTIRKSK